MGQWGSSFRSRRCFCCWLFLALAGLVWTPSVAFAQPQLTLAELPHPSEFASIAPFDLLIEVTDGWYFLNGAAQLSQMEVSTGYVDPIHGSVTLRVEPEGIIRVQDVDLSVVTSLPMVEGRFEEVMLSITNAPNQPLTLPPDSEGGDDECTITNIGRINPSGHFQLPWIVEVKSDRFDASMTVYIQTWGALGQVAPDRPIYGDFGVFVAMKNAPQQLVQGFDWLALSVLPMAPELPGGPMPYPLGPDPADPSVYWLPLIAADNINCIFGPCTSITDFEALETSVNEALEIVGPWCPPIPPEAVQALLPHSTLLVAQEMVSSQSNPALFAAAAEPPELQGLRFSAAEIQLLRRIDQIQQGAGIVETMLKAAPFIQLLSAPHPVDLAITIGTNDWDKIYGSITALRKIQACKVAEAINLWIVEGNSYSSDKSQRFFETLLAKAEEICS